MKKKKTEEAKQESAALEAGIEKARKAPGKRARRKSPAAVDVKESATGAVS